MTLQRMVTMSDKAQYGKNWNTGINLISQEYLETNFSGEFEMK